VIFLRLFFTILITYAATLSRYFVDNIFLVSLIASFIYGLFLPVRINNRFVKDLIFVYFLSSFTTYSGFIFNLFKLFSEENYLVIFYHINLVIFLNLFLMYLGFLFGKKISTKYNISNR